MTTYRQNHTIEESTAVVPFSTAIGIEHALYAQRLVQAVQQAKSEHFRPLQFVFTVLFERSDPR